MLGAIFAGTYELFKCFSQPTDGSYRAGPDFNITVDGCWQYELGSWFNFGPRICLLSFLCPCVALGSVNEQIGRKGWPYCALYFLNPLCCGTWAVTDTRFKFMMRFGILDEGPMRNFCLAMWCTSCVLIQMLQEVENQKNSSPLYDADHPEVKISSTKT